MKREIEFRGKRVDNGEWVYGDLRQYKNMGGKCKYFYTIDTMSTEFGLGTNYDVIEETVGQYTGIKDKNGKKVYEGDRVKVTYIEKRKYQGVAYDDEHCLTEEVFYSEENACFMLKVMCYDIPMYRPFHNFESLAKIKEIEVIGTIFDKESDNGD